jgi:putative selenate reductase
MLSLFDCISCDKCIPVCPNDANFFVEIAAIEQAWERVVVDGPGKVTISDAESPYKVERTHQLANFADFCNECGNCDVFCPEDGGPYIVKPRFFGSLATWEAFPDHDGFFLEREGDLVRTRGRFSGRRLILETADGESFRYRGEGFDVTLRADDPIGSIDGEATAEVDLTYYLILDLVRRAVLAPGRVNPVSVLLET